MFDYGPACEILARMKVFIVFAHAEPRSFNGAMFRAAQDTLHAAGHAVVVSDLYAMKFDPVSDRRNFTTVKNPEFFKQQNEEMYATGRAALPPRSRRNCARWKRAT